MLAFSPEPVHFSTHAYAASKGAVISMSRAMAAQYVAKGIRVNVIAPALVKSPMSARAQADQEILDFIRQKQPLSGGLLEAADVAETALFLLSERSSGVPAGDAGSFWQPPGIMRAIACRHRRPGRMVTRTQRGRSRQAVAAMA